MADKIVYGTYRTQGLVERREREFNQMNQYACTYT
jgi:hypothetical protein